MATAIAEPQTASQTLSQAENWVVQQVAKGQEADLKKQFPDEKDRKLSAHFLEQLLTGELPGLKLDRHGVRILWAVVDGPIDLSNAEIPCEVDLKACQFKDRVNFNFAHFKAGVSFYQGTFKEKAGFNTMKVDGTAVFEEAKFEALADFTATGIGIQFNADRASFTNRASFNGMKVGQTAFFREAVFDGQADFGLAEITGNFEANSARFQKYASFKSMKVKGDAIFNAIKESQRSPGKPGEPAVFAGGVSFIGADMSGDFRAIEAKFQDEASFSVMKVGGDARFEKAIFEGPANFIETHVAGSLRASWAQFKNKDKDKDNLFSFDSINVGAAFFSNAVFEGPVNFLWAEIGNNFQANDAKFKKETQFSGMRVGGDGLFRNVKFADQVAFRRTDFGGLNLFSVAWPAPDKTQMQGMKYKFIHLVKGKDTRPVKDVEHDSRKALLELPEKWAYTPDVYSTLEEFFLNEGDRSGADEIFIKGKQRERGQYLEESNWLRRDWLAWSGSLFLDWFVGYGRRTWQATIPCALLVALGCLLFSREKMEPQRPDDAPRVYNRFWYSLGLFLPVGNLQAETVWKPRPDQTFLRSYLRVHSLAGWILIPVVVGALTGLIK
jgi:hypothetical protein